MLNRENRLILGKDFDLVYKNGHISSSESVSLRSIKNKIGISRVGFSIGIKFSPRAVDRNKAKRWLREMVKRQLKEIKSGFDIVIMLKKEKTLPAYQKLGQNLKNALQKGGLFVK